MAKKPKSLFYFKAVAGFPQWETKEPVEFLLKHEGKTFWCEIGRETGVRTLPQNSALHVGLQLIADALNDSGLDIRKVLKPEVDIPWTVESVKEYLYRPIQKIMTGKSSSTELDKAEPSEVFDVLTRHLAEKHHIEAIPFPSEANRNK